MEICIVVSVYFWYCFIYWADTSLLSYICIYIWQSQRSVTGRILVVYTSHDLINTVWRLPVIFDRGRRFLDMFKTNRPAHFHPFCSHDHSRSIKTNVRQSCTLFFTFLSCLIVKAPKSFKRHVYICCYHLLQNQVHENAQRPLLNLFC